MEYGCKTSAGAKLQFLCAGQLNAGAHAIGELSPDERDKLLYVVDGLLRDARARRAYAGA